MFQASLIPVLVCRWLAILAIAWLGFSTVQAKESVVVMTSFGKEVTSAYKARFEANFPLFSVEFINVPTTSAVSLLRDRREGARPDVFWSSAPEAFDVLARLNYLTKAGELGDPLIPAKIGNFDVNDPLGFFKGQALSGYGIMWNTRYMKAKNLPLPQDWSDLGNPVYFGHLIMTSPSRSGTTHLIVEAILQTYGWEEGWRQLLLIGGNCGEISERSFGVPDGVNRGHYGLGPVIDFLGLAGKNTGFPVDFIYPRKNAVFPANIAIIEGAKNPLGARKFVSYALSQEGQSILLRPEISRFPVLPSVFANNIAPAGIPNLYEVIRNTTLKFDRSISERRYRIVSSMFDQLITFRHVELKRAIKRIIEAENLLSKRHNPEATALAVKARAMILFVPVSEAQILNPEFVQELSARHHTSGGHMKLAELERRLARDIKENYLESEMLAQRAITLANTSAGSTP
ncbi:MAG: ABC transporter substrate-binding protein [Betaproteobacteria bacterium]